MEVKSYRWISAEVWNCRFAVWTGTCSSVHMVQPSQIIHNQNNSTSILFSYAVLLSLVHQMNLKCHNAQSLSLLISMWLCYDVSQSNASFRLWSCVEPNLIYFQDLLQVQPPLPHHCFSTEQIQQQTWVQIKAGTALLILAKASERKMYGTAENQPNLGLEKIMQRYENVFGSSLSSQL